MSSSSSSSSLSSLIPVGVAGATGIVGQRFLSLLEKHPYFKVVAITASEKSEGRKLLDVTSWKLAVEPPSSLLSSLLLLPTHPSSFLTTGCRLVFSALDSSIAGTFEEELVKEGIPVFSNAKNHRMDAGVPILVPHANADHIRLTQQVLAQKDGVGEQKKKRGFIITNANCSSTGLAVALRPLHAHYGIVSLFVTTLQAVSGAGYPGVPSLDIVDNIIPFIGEEEDKMEMEPQKILGEVGDGQMEGREREREKRKDEGGEKRCLQQWQ